MIIISHSEQLVQQREIKSDENRKIERQRDCLDILMIFYVKCQNMKEGDIAI